MSQETRPTLSVFLEPGRFGEDSCSSISCISSDTESTFKEHIDPLLCRKDQLFDGEHIQKNCCLLSQHAENGVGFLYNSALNTKAPCQIDTFFGMLAARIKNRNETFYNQYFGLSLFSNNI